MHILLLILIFIFVLFGIIFSIFGKVLSFLFGGLFGKKNNQQNYSSNSGRGYYDGQKQNNHSQQTENPKVFSSKEGEYVNYEEVE